MLLSLCKKLTISVSFVGLIHIQSIMSMFSSLTMKSLTIMKPFCEYMNIKLCKICAWEIMFSSRDENKFVYLLF